jgi:predicted RNA methylase
LSAIEQIVERVYDAFEGSDVIEAYRARHGVRSAGILTVYSDETADLIASHLAPRIEGRVVVEVGGGIGLLACHMARYAKRVWCIEADPNWAPAFIVALMRERPKNLSYLFGAASEFYGTIRGDVALFCTHSDAAGMHEIGTHFAREVIDVYGEIVKPEWNPLRDLTR